MSATQSLFGPSALKYRSTRSGAGLESASRMVVQVPLRRLTPCKPAAFISRATRLRPTWTPRSASSAWIIGAPYAPLDIV